MLAGEIRCLVELRARVSECPLWDWERRTLHFVDIYGGKIVTFDWSTGGLSLVSVGQHVGSIGLAGPERMICGLQASIALVDLATGALHQLADIEHVRPDSRLNDGRCDPGGRFWVGSMKESLDEPTGVLYRVDTDGSITVQAEHIICSNGLAWSPDGRVMYHADSRQKTVWRYDYDVASGTATNPRTFFTTPDGEGRPDGAAVDQEGCYWMARYDGWRIVRHAPDGRELFTLRTPVQHPTMCAFAGDDLSTLVFTSARGSLSEAELATQPLAGSVFAVDVTVRGLKEPGFTLNAPAGAK